MQAMNDEQQLERLERKVDDGFAECRTEFRAIRAELRREIGTVRGEMRSEIGSVRSEMRSEIGSVRSEMRSEIGSVRSEIGSINRTIQAMWLTMILGFAAILLQHL